MANAVYPEYYDAILTGATNVSLTAGNLKVVLVDTAEYTYSSTHQYLTDLPVAARVATSTAIANTTVNNGVLDGDDVSIASVTGPTIEACVVFIDTGAEATSRLVLYLDQISSFPFTPSSPGGTLNINWHSNGICTF